MNQPLAVLFKKNKQMPLIALCLGFFMVIIDVTIVNVALPNMAKNLGGGVSWLQWVVDGYTLTFACLLLSAGSLGDRVGAKSAYLSGLILFVLTSLACGLATNFLLLTIFRLLQGIAAALLVPTSVALINAAYENKIERARAIGVWASVGGLAAASGPVLGAVLTSWFGWRGVFFVNIPIGLIGLLLTTKYVINPVSAGFKHGFDFPGQVTGIISIAALAFSLIEAGRLGWSSETVIGGLLLFIATFIIFLVIEHRTKSPMFPLTFFRSKTFSVSMAVGMILNIGFYGQLFLLPLYFQQLREYSVLMTGLAILPQTGLSALASYFGGRVASVSGPKLPMVVGLAVGAAGFFSLLITGEQSPSYILLILPLAAIGFGVTFTMPASTIAIINSVPSDRTGIASGAFNTSRQVGSLIGVAVFGTILNTATNFISGMHIGLMIGGVAFAFGCIATLVWVD